MSKIANVGDHVKTNGRLCKVIDRTERVYDYEDVISRDRFSVSVMGNYPTKVDLPMSLRLLCHELAEIKRKAAPWVGSSLFLSAEWLIDFAVSELDQQ